MLRDKRIRPLFIKDVYGNIYQSYYLKIGLHFCKGYHLVLEQDVVDKSYFEERLAK